MSRLAIAVLLLITGCAHPVPVLDAPIAASAPVLDLNEALPATAQICVMRNPWNDATPVCITVGDLRRLLRHRGEVAAHGLGR